MECSHVTQSAHLDYDAPTSCRLWRAISRRLLLPRRSSVGDCHCAISGGRANRLRSCASTNATAFCRHSALHCAKYDDGDRTSALSDRQAGFFHRTSGFPPAPLEGRHGTFDAQHTHRVFSWTLSVCIENESALVAISTTPLDG